MKYFWAFIALIVVGILGLLGYSYVQQQNALMAAQQTAAANGILGVNVPGVGSLNVTGVNSLLNMIFGGSSTPAPDSSLAGLPDPSAF